MRHILQKLRWIFIALFLVLIFVPGDLFDYMETLATVFITMAILSFIFGKEKPKPHSPQNSELPTVKKTDNILTRIGWICILLIFAFSFIWPSDSWNKTDILIVFLTVLAFSGFLIGRILFNIQDVRNKYRAFGNLFIYTAVLTIFSCSVIAGIYWYIDSTGSYIPIQVKHDWQYAIGQIVNAKQSGSYVNDNPEIVFTLEYKTADGHHYISEARKTLALMAIPMIQPGKAFPIRYDPHNPKHIVIDFNMDNNTWYKLQENQNNTSANSAQNAITLDSNDDVNIKTKWLPYLLLSTGALSGISLLYLMFSTKTLRPAVGTLVRVKQLTHGESNEGLELEFEYTTEDGRKITATAQKSVPQIDVVKYQPGLCFPLRYDRSNLQDVILDSTNPTNLQDIINQKALRDGTATQKTIDMMKNGIQASGVVLTLVATGMIIEGKAEMRIQLLVTKPDGKKYETIVTKAASEKFIPHIQPGCTLKVYYMPGNEQDVSLAVPGII